MKPGEEDKAPISARRAFLRADFFACMLDYQATTARMSQQLDEAALAAGKAMQEREQAPLIENYMNRLDKGRRRLRLRRALSDEELHEIRDDLRNMPAAVRRHLTDRATSEMDSADKTAPDIGTIAPPCLQR